MNVHTLTQIGFIPATVKSLGYLKNLAGFSDKQKLNIEWDTILEGVLIHKENKRLFLIIKPASTSEFTLLFARDQEVNDLITVSTRVPGNRDKSFEEFIISEYVKKHVKDTLE